MPDGRGGYGSESRSKILRACEKCWPEVGPNSLPNRADCSGFVRAVMADLGLQPLPGTANDMYYNVRMSAEWDIIGLGPLASHLAGMSANEGKFVLALWRNPSGHGHVSIIVADMSNSYKRQRIEQNVMGYWGQIGGEGRQFEKITKSYGSKKLPEVLYAAYHRLV